VDFDVVACLVNINTIEFGEEVLTSEVDLGTNCGNEAFSKGQVRASNR
jgi:hypothetical protein